VAGFVASSPGLADWLEPPPGDSLGEDMTGLESGLGVGLVDGFGLPVSLSAHGLAVAVFLLVDDAAGGEGDVDGLGLVLGEAEPVALGDGEAVALAVGEMLGLVVGDGEPDGDVDGIDEGVQDWTGVAAGTCDVCPADLVAPG
jgi:hypothetical protein